jgi:hypothetical protein
MISIMVSLRFLMASSITKDLGGGSALRLADAPFNMTTENTLPLAFDALAGFETPQLLFSMLIRRFEVHDRLRVVDGVHLALKW